MTAKSTFWAFINVLKIADTHSHTAGGTYHHVIDRIIHGPHPHLRNMRVKYTLLVRII